MTVEKRLYIILPATIDVPETRQIIPMSCGRLFAQAIHVGSKIKQHEKMDPDLETTTIVLRVENSKELDAVLDKVKKAGIPWQTFLDTNAEVYGTEAALLTAVAALCSRKKGKSLFFGIDSWKCNND
jgi:predicted DNA binding CopG/RHH family protein